MRHPLYFLLPAALLTGCLSGKSKLPPRGSAPAETVLQAALANTLNPRQYGITVYRSPEGPVFTDVNRVHPAQEDMLEFAEKKSPLPVAIWETQSRDEVPVLFDSRSPKTWAEFLTAQMLGFRAAGPNAFAARPTHVADGVESYMAILPSLPFGAVRFENALWQVRPQYGTLGPLGRGLEKPEPLVVVGFDVMQSLSYVRFDFHARTVSYATDMPYRSSKVYRVADLPFKRTAQGLSVEAMLDGQRTPLIIDTGGDYLLAINQQQGDQPVIRRVVIGDFARVSVPVNDAEFLGLGAEAPPSAGARLFDGLILVLDFENGRFVLETPPPATP